MHRNFLTRIIDYRTLYAAANFPKVILPALGIELSRTGLPHATLEEMSSRIETFMTTFDVRERFERRVNAPPHIVMRTAYEFDMQSIWLIRAIINLRKFILGGTSAKRSPIGIVEESLKIGWGKLIEEPGKLLVCGAVCQPWIGDVKFTPMPASEFAAYSVPDQVKIVWSLEAEETEPNISLFSHEVRAVATDHEAKRKFMKYWRWSRFGIVAIRLLLLPAIRRRAENEWRSVRDGH